MLVLIILKECWKPFQFLSGQILRLEKCMEKLCQHLGMAKLCQHLDISSLSSSNMVSGYDDKLGIRFKLDWYKRGIFIIWDV